MTPKRTNPIAVVEGVESRFFHPSAAAGTIRHIYQTRFESQSQRGNAFRASRLVSENSALFKKLEAGVQFYWERISSSEQPSRSTSGSEAAPTTRSPYSSFRDQERSLDRGSLRRALRHSAKTVHFSLAYGNSQPHFPPSRIDPGRPTFQRANVEHSETPIVVTLITDLSADHEFSTSPQQRGEGLSQRPPIAFRQEKYRQLVKNQGEDVHGALFCPTCLRTTAFEAKYSPALLPLPGLPTNFVPVGGRAQTTLQGCR